MYDRHTKGMATTRHRSLVGRGERKGFEQDKGLAQYVYIYVSIYQHTDISNLKKKIEKTKLQIY